MDVTYKTQAYIVGNQLEILGQVYPDSVMSRGLIDLKNSMRRIQGIDNPTEALQDHFNAMCSLSDKEIKVLKTLPGNVFGMCEVLLRLLKDSGARVKF